MKTNETMLFNLSKDKAVGKDPLNWIYYEYQKYKHSNKGTDGEWVAKWFYPTLEECYADLKWEFKDDLKIIEVLDREMLETVNKSKAIKKEINI